jgi:hypothetical protein
MITKGGVWAKTAGATDISIMFFDGVVDHEIGSVVGGVAKFGGATFNSGATASKPATAVKGDMFFDTTLNRLEVYDGGVWKTNAPANVLNGSTSGAITLATPAVAGTNTATFPAATGTVMVSGNMPAFSAHANANQSVTSATYTKVLLQTEVFDTNNNFDNTTNYRFTPTVAGYYQINGVIRANGTGLTGIIASIYKNGNQYSLGTATDGTVADSGQGVVSEIVFLNGSTDYVELYGFVVAASGASFGHFTTAVNCRFNGCLVRGS